jgi:putative membrane protein
MKTLTLQKSIGLAAMVAATLLCLSVKAATPAERSPSMLKHADRSFVKKAAKSGMAEVNISRVAVERTSNQQVREFAQMMVADHTKANTKLADLASSKGVMLPMGDDDDTADWAKKDVKDFDEDYIDKMVSDHKDAVDLFEKEAKKGDDPDLAAFARETLPTLQQHLAKANALKEMLD